MTKSKPALPAESTGTAITRFNALQHGVLSRYTVLPWEDTEEYSGLVSALVAEHAPQGPTEEHLVEEVAGVLWRKRRLRLAEAAVHRRGLSSTLASNRGTVKAAMAHLDGEADADRLIDAIRATASDTHDACRDLDEDELVTRRSVELLDSRRNDAYEVALAALGEGTREWWADELARGPEEPEEDEKPATEDVEGLKRFLDDKVLPWFETYRMQLDRRPLIREQAFGEALDPDKLERLGRYEVHLDRKLKRMLTMLVRLR